MTRKTEYQPPFWLLGLLQGIWESEEALDSMLEIHKDAPDRFKEICRQSAKAAHALMVLRKEKERVGFVPLPFGDYVKSIAKAADILLDPVLTWLKISDISSISTNSISSLSRLAKILGFSLRETLVQLRISYAIGHNLKPVMLPVRQRSTSVKHSQLDEYERLLSSVENDLDVDALRELRAIEQKLISSYESHEHDL